MYNGELDANHSRVFSSCQNIPISKYISLDSLYSNGNDNLITLLNMNIRSVPTNLQGFVDTILINSNVKFDVLDFT